MAVSQAVAELIVVWTGPAKKQIAILGDEVKEEHERRVKRYARAYVPHATTARIRKVDHTGGINPYEREHITVAYKHRNKELGTCHVYADNLDDESSHSEDEWILPTEHFDATSL